jgi:site-specific DNA recombinase
MLRRELYIGRMVWNRSRFVKKPGTNHRVRRARPQSEWKSLEKPDLRIVSDDLWCAVGQRFAKVKATYQGYGKGGGYLARSATSSYLFSGLLRCGVCGGNLVIVTGNKGRHRRYGCSQHYYRGTCANAVTERQEWLEQKLVRELQEQILTPPAIDFALEEFGRQLKAELGKISGSLGDMRARKVELETELRRYAEALGVGGSIPAIIEAMKIRQRELDSITERLLSTRPDSIEARIADIRRFVTKRILDLRELLSKDVLLAKPELLKHVQEIRMIPRVDENGAHYEATGEWSLLGHTLESGPGTRPSNWVGCGGWI